MSVLASRVDEAVAALPAAEQRVLALKEKDGADYRAIGEELGVGREGVAELLVSARLSVWGHLHEAGPPPRRTPQCAPARYVLAAQGDGEAVSAGDLDRAREHLAGCEPCQAARLALREAEIACRTWTTTPAVSPDGGYSHREATQTARPSLVVGRRRLIAAAAALLLFIAVLVAAFGGDDPAPHARCPQARPRLRPGSRPGRRPAPRRQVLPRRAAGLQVTAQIMGVLNATPDSFSDDRSAKTTDDRLRQAEALLAAGADLLDIGGESNVTNRPAVSVEEELDRVVALIERVTGELGARVSVDTYKPAVADAAVAAGASIVNDISGLADPGLGEVCARTGAALVVMHTPVAPKQQSLDEDRAMDVVGWLRDRAAYAQSLGVRDLILDPGPDFGKTPAQTVAVLRDLPSLVALGHPVLLAVSRKDFVGAIVERRPRERLAGTLAAIGFGVDAGATYLRVHDVAEVRDYLAVRAVLRGERELPAGARVPEHLRREPVS